jgi:hypothetical protein
MSIAQLLKAIGQRKSKLRFYSKDLHGCNIVSTTRSRPLQWMLRHIPFAGKIMKSSTGLEGMSIRWGGDWDGDGDFKDQTLVDLVHWEING